MRQWLLLPRPVRLSSLALLGQPFALLRPLVARCRHELVLDVEPPDVADIFDRLQANPTPHDPFDAAKPTIGIEPFLFGRAAQPLYAGPAGIVCPQREVDPCVGGKARLVEDTVANLDVFDRAQFQRRCGCEFPPIHIETAGPLHCKRFGTCPGTAPSAERQGHRGSRRPCPCPFKPRCIRSGLDRKSRWPCLSRRGSWSMVGPGETRWTSSAGRC